jgi:hypothetical protein
VLSVRRYRCRHCGTVVTVVPRGVARRRHFSAGTIGLGLLLFGHEQGSVRRIREVLGGAGPPDAADWITLRRWCRAVESGALFGVVRPSPAGFTLRQRAERAAMTLVSFAPSTSGGLDAQVFAGAMVVARAA